jgi:maltokinase
VSDSAARSRAAAGPGWLAGADATGALLDMLAGWLPRQRWFPGRGGALSGLAIISDISLQAGYPGLRHLIVEAPVRGGGRARFQVPVGYRPELPASLAGALIGTCDGVACYDALHDPELAAVLLRGISEQRLAGQIRFVREPAAPSLAALSHAGRLLGAEQSNTSLVFADRAILKMLRRLFPGANPDLEVAGALAGLGSARVAAPFGWIETDLDGESVLLGVLSQFLGGASDGWTLALSALAGGRPFANEARLLGETTADVHADLARAFGSRDMTAAEQAELASSMHGKLSAAIELVADLRLHEARIRAVYDAVGDLAGPVALQRIHGDYHLGQVLRAAQGWVALDFEGEPAVSLAERRAFAPALRDVAGMLRSFDYASRHQLVGQPGAGEMAETASASAWAQQCQEAFCAGYAAGGGSDPAANDPLLRALTLEKAVYEVVYEYRHRPTWLSIPLDFVAAA